MADQLLFQFNLKKLRFADHSPIKPKFPASRVVLQKF